MQGAPEERQQGHRDAKRLRTEQQERIGGIPQREEQQHAKHPPEAAWQPGPFATADLA